MEQICAADAANKNKTVALDESFPRNARRIRALQLHRKSQAEKEFHRRPTKGKFRAKRATATSRTRRCGGRRFPCAPAIETRQCPPVETHKQSAPSSTSQR